MKTANKKLEQINEYYSNNLSCEDAIESLIYLTNKNRGKYVTENHLRNCYYSCTLGNLLKKLDPIAFNLFFE